MNFVGNIGIFQITQSYRRVAISFFLSAGLSYLTCCRSNPSTPPQPHIYVQNENTTAFTLSIVPSNSVYFLRAAVNGQDAGYFLIDTGSNNTGVTSLMANRLHLPYMGQSFVQGIGARKVVNRRRIDSLVAGNLDFGTRIASEIEVGNFGSRNMTVGGLLGFDTLGNRVFSLDFKGQTLQIRNAGDVATPSYSSVEELHLIEGLPAVRAEVEGYAMWLILDTGASATLMLPGATVERWSGFLNMKNNRHTQSWGATGPVNNVTTIARSLRIFGMELINTSANVEWTPRILEYDGLPVGRIGMGILRDCLLTFDASKAKLYVQWRP
ncbi:MAG: aspartyl protease family protein [Phycisphaeraceae bacterium]|nr:aspartyl protease family protein [Phycisphaeraceae bacterium]